MKNTLACTQSTVTAKDANSASGTRTIKAYPVDGLKCECCGKDRAKRKGKSPAPVRLIIGQTMLALCMVCAKKISSCLDTAIARIERKYE